jgi:hypothetical protein
MNYRFRAARSFWKSFAKLPERQQSLARETFRIFKANPFDARLRAHKIHSLSAYYKRTIYAVVIEGDLRAVFYLDGDTVFTVDIGTHAIYRV